MASNRIPVYLPAKTQPSSPPHRTSAAFAALLVSCNWAKLINKNDSKAGIIVCTSMNWAEIKTYFRGGSTTLPIPKILPPRKPESLILSYPPRDYESKAAENRKKLWSGDAMIPAAER